MEQITIHTSQVLRFERKTDPNAINPNIDPTQPNKAVEYFTTRTGEDRFQPQLAPAWIMDTTNFALATRPHPQTGIPVLRVYREMPTVVPMTEPYNPRILSPLESTPAPAGDIDPKEVKKARAASKKAAADKEAADKEAEDAKDAQDKAAAEAAAAQNQ